MQLQNLWVWQSHVAFLQLLLTTRTMASSEVFAIESVIRGHHVWTPFEGEKLVLEREHHNSHDCYATTVMKDDVIIVPNFEKLTSGTLNSTTSHTYF